MGFSQNTASPRPAAASTCAAWAAEVEVTSTKSRPMARSSAGSRVTASPKRSRATARFSGPRLQAATTRARPCQASPMWRVSCCPTLPNPITPPFSIPDALPAWRKG